MKKIRLFIILLFIASAGFAQVEVNNATGNMAIGTTPNAKTKLLLQNQIVAATDTVFGLQSIVRNRNNTVDKPMYGAYFSNTLSGNNAKTLYGTYLDNTNNSFSSGGNGNTGSVYGVYSKNYGGCAYGFYTENTAGSYNNSIYGLYANNKSSNSYSGTLYGAYLKNIRQQNAYSSTLHGVRIENACYSTVGSIYGVSLTATGSSDISIYGIYSAVSNGNPNQRYSGYFTGGKVLVDNDLYVNLDIYARGLKINSDERLKSDIKPLNTEIDKLYKLQGKSYKKSAIVIELQDSLSIELRAEYKKEKVDDVAEFGYLAQELKEVFPELVSKDSTTGYYSVNYIGLIPVVVEALKAQQQKIEYLEKTIADFDTNNTLKSAEIGESETIQNMYLPDNVAIEELKLYQNAPNPFNERTTVKCYVPQQIQKVQLCVYNMQGVQVQCITIVERGNVSVEIEAGALSAGIYSYVLLADGAASETKQMILTK